MDNLDEHIIEGILLNLTPVDIVTCASLSHRFNRIITASASIQLELYKHIYDPAESYITDSTSYVPIKQRLLNLIKRERNFQDSGPKIKNYKLESGQVFVAAKGKHIVTRSRVAPETSSQQTHREQSYPTYNIWTYQDEDDMWEKQQLRVPFAPDLRQDLVDLDKGVIIIQQYHRSPLRIILHVFHPLTGTLTPDSCSGAIEISLDEFAHPHPSTRRSEKPSIKLGPRNLVQVSYRKKIRFYDYIKGLLTYTLESVDSLRECISIGPNFVGIALPSIYRNVPFRHLLVYSIDLLPSTEAHTLTQPIFALRFPSRGSRLPHDVQEEVSQEYALALPYDDMYMRGTINRFDSISICCSLGDYPHADDGSAHTTPPPNPFGADADSTIYLPVRNIEDVFLDLKMGGKRYKFDVQDDPEFIQDFPGLPTIDWNIWKRHTVVTCTAPDTGDDDNKGSKIINCDQMYISEPGQGMDQLGPVQLTTYELDLRPAKFHTELGFAIGESRHCLDNNARESGERDVSIKTTSSVLEKVDVMRVEASDDTLGFTRKVYTVKTKGDMAGRVFFDGNKLFMTYRNSVVDVFDFTA
ncbi:hypothetical protein I302_107307 [Kwoniella bestiolae CBS 10118]|uniref:F-box domain-containing protein n=1 Tax=Kwoniella bestiolae CBS 10118 TaxID=1296100 RepID=A0A1B9FYY4_9TREE|nr:hypothetical protein I302_06957 [Kwoniella bestiolae CBS 10118]OCF23971.1 hypothetical protein I302_06957 [Kwoniella bestiolae CBS 10118]